MMTPSTIITGSSALAALKSFHPLIIEGMGAYDPRSPKTVASLLISKIKPRIQSQTKPVILITQGDPLSDSGISRITRLIADDLDIKRGLICLDSFIDSSHCLNADRYSTILELRYSELLEYVDIQKIEFSVDESLRVKNAKKIKVEGKELAEYYRNFALLQEVTKAATKNICGGDITIVHTQVKEEISEFSVTSFYEVGLSLDLYSEVDFV
ncbi:hypothetical protein TL16_g05162 [Triparma laevis f. inornata]|uniref:Uncharacterized protein n=2 Tax=Triparma laevis TaxID=1534972 RepID=A0A9W7C9E0_9STRA|nr:hypothetical protein TL16_g05162 [Triparma laevis f. inornata]GMI01605.1 hypothetical protein TrLO_g10225 [Triparma laevis f. longispina]